MKITRLSEQIIPAYHKVFNSRKYARQIYTSGRAGTKSSKMGIRVVQDIVSSECAVVVMRKRHNKLRKTVFKEVIRAISRLGIPKQAFKITVSPMQITYLKNGSTIYFSGNDNIDDTKGIIDDNFPITRVVIDELTEFFDFGEGADEIDQIEATFVRGNDSSFVMEMYYNPPKNKYAPINEWLDKQKQREDVIHIHTTYKDVPVEWLGQALIDIAEQMKNIDIEQYRWVWLGISTGLNELVYYMFDRDSHINKVDESHNLNNFIIGIDYGQLNATTFQCFALDSDNKKIVGIDEYFHSGRDTKDMKDIPKEQVTDYDKWKRQLAISCGKQKTPGDYAKDYITFIDFIEERYNTTIRHHVIDPSARGLAEEIRRLRPNISFITNKGVGTRINSVDLGIERVQKLLHYDVLNVNINQTEVIKEFHRYAYDKKSIEDGKPKVEKVNDHTMDAIRYIIMAMWNKHLKRLLPKGEQLDNE